MNSFLDSHQPEAAQFVLARFLGRDASPHGNMGKREMLFLFHDSVTNDKPARETASIDNHGGVGDGSKVENRDGSKVN